MINVTPTMSQNESLDLVNLPTEKTALEIQHLDLFYASVQYQNAQRYDSEFLDSF